MNPIALTTHEWSFSVAMTLPCLIFILVTCIYSWRIYIISNKNWFVSFVPVSLGLVPDWASPAEGVLV
ncbi:hypothetical protein EW145_g5850 [Phellinidium pouzarii]|uniref:Uncharacterized protein n=1 Tax=Phellinidium pouzarii TaxID=167371 RepID=A0A4S4KYN3_9AGAM|nr:hypothetical protein EW145_g5850 [Phellinidium pouzarii]